MENHDAYRTPASNVRGSDPAGEADVRPFTTKGRIGRSYYIIYSAGLGALLQILPVLLLGALSVTTGDTLAGVGLVLITVVYLFVIVFQFIWAVRRAHDADMSGWMCLLLFVPLAFLVFWFLPGTDGPNRYGPAPRRGPVWLAVLIGILIPTVFVAGILAAIGIPAYQEYLERAGAHATPAIVLPLEADGVNWRPALAADASISVNCKVISSANTAPA